MSISENNYKRNKSTSQQCWPNDIISQDPEFFFRNLTRTQRNLIEILIRWSLKYKHVYFRQDTVASILKISRQHCNRLIQWMRDCGLLVSEYRHKLSCHYTLSSFFFTPSIQSRLRHIFRPLRALSLGLLCSISSDVTQYIDKLNKNLTNLIVKRQTDESSMQFTQKYHGDKPVSEAIRGLKTLNLTRAGQIKLSAFPDEAILDAANAFKYAKKVKDPFGWFFKLCLEYCKRNEIDPDWSFMHALVDKYKISLSAPMIGISAPAVRDKTVRPENRYPTRDKTSHVPLVNATSKEYVEKTEWKGHTEAPRVAKDSAALRLPIINALQTKNSFIISLMRNYSLETQKNTIDLLSFNDSCYCELLKEVCGWPIDCLHILGESNEAQGVCPAW